MLVYLVTNTKNGKLYILAAKKKGKCNMSMTYQSNQLPGITNLTISSGPQEGTAANWNNYTLWQTAPAEGTISVTGEVTNTVTYTPDTWSNSNTYVTLPNNISNQWNGTLGGTFIPNPYGDPDFVEQVQKFMQAKKALEELKAKELEVILIPLTAAERKTLFFDLERG